MNSEQEAVEMFVNVAVTFCIRAYRRAKVVKPIVTHQTVLLELHISGVQLNSCFLRFLPIFSASHHINPPHSPSDNSSLFATRKFNRPVVDFSQRSILTMLVKSKPSRSKALTCAANPRQQHSTTLSRKQTPKKASHSRTPSRSARILHTSPTSPVSNPRSDPTSLKTRHGTTQSSEVPPNVFHHPHNFVPSTFQLPPTLHIPRKDLTSNDSHWSFQHQPSHTERPIDRADSSTIITPELLGGIMQTYPFGDIYRNLHGPNSLNQTQSSPLHPIIPTRKRMKLSIGVSGGVDSLGSTLTLSQWAQEHNRHVATYWSNFTSHITSLTHPHQNSLIPPIHASRPAATQSSHHITLPSTPPPPQSSNSTFPLNRDLLENNILVDIHGISVNHGLRPAAHLETFYVKHFLERICNVPCDIINIHMQSYDAPARHFTADTSNPDTTQLPTQPNHQLSTPSHNQHQPHHNPNSDDSRQDHNRTDQDDLYFLLPSTHSPDLDNNNNNNNDDDDNNNDNLHQSDSLTKHTPSNTNATQFVSKRFNFLVNTSSLQSLPSHGNHHGSATPSPSNILSNSTQDRARMLRYNAIMNHIHEIGSAGLITGHHLQDQQETIFYRLLRGSGLSGLQGMDSLTPIFCFPIHGQSISPPASFISPSPMHIKENNPQFGNSTASNPVTNPTVSTTLNQLPHSPETNSPQYTSSHTHSNPNNYLSFHNIKEKGDNYLPSHKFIPLLRPMLHFTHRDMISTFIHTTNEIFEEKSNHDNNLSNQHSNQLNNPSHRPPLHSQPHTSPTHPLSAQYHSKSTSAIASNNDSHETQEILPSLLNGWIEDPSNTDDHYDRIKIRRFLKQYLPIVSNRFKKDNLATLLHETVSLQSTSHTHGENSTQSGREPDNASPDWDLKSSSISHQLSTALNDPSVDSDVKKIIQGVDLSLGIDYIELLSKQVHSIVSEFMSKHVVFNATLRQCTITIPLHNPTNFPTNQQQSDLESHQLTHSPISRPLPTQPHPQPLSPLLQLLPTPLSLFDQVLSRSIATLSNGTMQPQHSSVETIRNALLQIPMENNQTLGQHKTLHSPHPFPYASDLEEFIKTGVFMLDTTTLEQRFNVTQVLGIQDCRIWSEIVFSSFPSSSTPIALQGSIASNTINTTDVIDHHPSQLNNQLLQSATIPRSFTKDSLVNLYKDPPLPRFVPTIPTHLAIHITHSQHQSTAQSPSQLTQPFSQHVPPLSTSQQPKQQLQPSTFPPSLSTLTLQPDHSTIVSILSQPSTPLDPANDFSHKTQHQRNNISPTPFTSHRKSLFSSISNSVLTNYKNHIRSLDLDAVKRQFSHYNDRTITLNTFQCLTTASPETAATSTINIDDQFYQKTLLSSFQRHLERSARRLTSLQPSLHIYTISSTQNSASRADNGLIVQHFYPTKAYKWFW